MVDVVCALDDLITIERASATRYDIYYNSIPIDPSRTVATVRLPAREQIHIFAMALQP